MKNRLFSQKSLIRGMTMVAVIALAGTGYHAWQVQAADDEKKTDLSLSALMRTKLIASSEILEGLTTENASLIEKGATTLRKLSKAEIWNFLTDSDYRAHTIEFQTNVDKLAEAAQKGNFDNAAMQWFDTTKSCIECHQHVRRARASKK